MGTITIDQRIERLREEIAHKELMIRELEGLRAHYSDQEGEPYLKDDFNFGG